MISWEAALDQILAQIRPLEAISLPLEKMLGCVLAQTVVAPIDGPQFDNSAVDGFAIKLPDVADASPDHPVSLSVAGEIRAGGQGSQTHLLRPGHALKVLTGAFVPASADAVIMKEHCREANGKVEVSCSAALGENIRRRGAEFLRGHTLLAEGLLVTPPVVGLLAGLGYRKFKVRRRPRAAVVSTGSELTLPGRTLLPGYIYDSNSYSLRASLAAAGVEDILMLRALEQRKATVNAFKSALAFADVIVSTGGVSVGDYDFVKEALESLGVQSHIWRIAMKPGKPVFFGVHTSAINGRRRYVFGLPGNPVSALVTFNLFVLSALARLMGVKAGGTKTIGAVLHGNLHKKAGRAEFVRARLTWEQNRFQVTPVRAQDSHMLTGLALANALIVFPREAEKLFDGQTVDTIHLRFDLQSLYLA